MISKLAHLIFPHESNNHKAKIIRPSGLSLILIALLFVQLFIHKANGLGPSVLGYAANISPDEVIRLTNEKRAQNGIGPVVYNASLSQAAQAKAADMLSKDYWAHVAPDGTEPWKFFRDVGYRYKYAGENLARDFSNPSSTVEAWMASPSHRDNLLSSKYKDIGIAVIEGDMAGVDTTIVVQLFGTRVGDSLPVEPIAQVNTIPTIQPTVRPTANPISPTTSPELITQLTPMPSSVPLGTTQKILISPLNVTKTVSGTIIAALLVVLLIDMVIISRRRIARVSSRSFAHFAFFAMIVVVLVMAKAGSLI